MMKIFAVFPGTIPNFPEIEKALSKKYTFVLVDKVEALAKHRDERGIVLLGGESDRLNTLTGMLRSIAPRLGCVLVVEKDKLKKLDLGTVDHADVLTVPFTTVELHGRINAAMHMSELRHLIEESAQLDEVTELYNSNYFIKRVGEEMSLAKRHLSPMACVVISIHHYEMLMDTYGYKEVANFVRQVALEVKEQVRQEDVVARLGDSEIAFLLPRSTEKGAETLTRRIVKNLESTPIYMGDQIEHLFLKAGIAGFPAPDEGPMDPDTLIRYARHALHHARCMENVKVQLFCELKPQVG